MSAQALLERREVCRRAVRHQRKDSLRAVLAYLRVNEYTPESVALVKAAKVEKADAAFPQMRRRFIRRQRIAKVFGEAVSMSSLIEMPCVVCFLGGGLAALGYALYSWWLNLTVASAALWLAAALLSFGLAAFPVAWGIAYQPEKQRWFDRCLAALKQSCLDDDGNLPARLAWTETTVRDYPGELPPRVKRRMHRIRSRCPNAEFFVEHTVMTETVPFNKYDWLPLIDPFLRVEDGVSRFYIDAWDEHGRDLESRPVS